MFSEIQKHVDLGKDCFFVSVFLLGFASKVVFEPPMTTALRFYDGEDGNDISKLAKRFIKLGDGKEEAESILRDNGFIVYGGNRSINCVDGIIRDRFLFPYVFPVHTHVEICFEDKKVSMVSGRISFTAP